MYIYFFKLNKKPTLNSYIIVRSRANDSNTKISKVGNYVVGHSMTLQRKKRLHISGTSRKLKNDVLQNLVLLEKGWKSGSKTIEVLFISSSIVFVSFVSIAICLS